MVNRFQPALDYVPTEKFDVATPTGSIFRGVQQTRSVCGVSILRAGASMEEALRRSYKYDGYIHTGRSMLTSEQRTVELWEDIDPAG